MGLAGDGFTGRNPGTGCMGTLKIGNLKLEIGNWKSRKPMKGSAGDGFADGGSGSGRRGTLEIENWKLEIGNREG